MHRGSGRPSCSPSSPNSFHPGKDRNAALDHVGGMPTAGQADVGARPARLAPEFRDCWCWLVGVAGGLVDAAAGCSPGHLPGSGLGEVPAVGLLAPVVMAAERGEVAFAGPAAFVVGDGVVEVAAGGGATAAGVGAAALPHLHEVAQVAGGRVAGGLAGVAAAAGLQDLEAGAQAGGPPDDGLAGGGAGGGAGVGGGRPVR
jgi:hypothetical protein